MGASADAPILSLTEGVGMSAFFGLLLITLAVGLFGGALVLSRRPKAPVQSTESVAASVVAITTIALFATGLGLIIQFVMSYGREPLTPVTAALTAATLIALLVAFAAIGRRLRGHKQLHTSGEVELHSQAGPPMSPAPGTETSYLTNGSGPEVPPQAPSPASVRAGAARKRAA
jgi:hypothetical protein